MCSAGHDWELRSHNSIDNAERDYQSFSSPPNTDGSVG